MASIVLYKSFTSTRKLYDISIKTFPLPQSQQFITSTATIPLVTGARITPLCDFIVAHPIYCSPMSRRYISFQFMTGKYDPPHILVKTHKTRLSPPGSTSPYPELSDEFIFSLIWGLGGVCDPEKDTQRRTRQRSIRIDVKDACDVPSDPRLVLGRGRPEEAREKGETTKNMLRVRRMGDG